MDMGNKDNLTEIIGKYGRFQYTWGFLGSLTLAFHAMMMMSNKWLTFEVHHWCARPLSLKDMTVEQWWNISRPIQNKGDLEKCYIFDVDYDNVQGRPSEDTPSIPCNKWEYETFMFQNTATQRWNLVCDRSYLRQVIQITFFIGNFFGVFVSGFISDYFGRKFGYMLFLTLWIIFGAVGSHISNFYLWLMCRFMCGALSLAYNNVFSVFLMELTHGKWRSWLTHLFCGIGWYSGIIVLGFLVYIIGDMIMLELMIGLCNLPFLMLWYFMPESPRWLLAQDKKEEAKRVILLACKMNNQPPEQVENFLKSFNNNSKVLRSGFLDMFKDAAIRRNTLIMCFVWFSISMGYMGLTYNTPPLQWNVYVVFVFPALIGLVKVPLNSYLENKFGRKFMLTVPLIFAGILLLITTVLPTGHVAIIVLAWFGTTLCGIAFTTGYIFTKELYPTKLRSQALSTASASARIGSILSPFIASLYVFHYLLPILIYGAILFLAGFLSIWIWPETMDIKLPDTLDDCKILAAGKNSWTSCLFQCKNSRASKKKCSLT